MARPRVTPRRPNRRIKRSTVHRARLGQLGLMSRQTLRAPYLSRLSSIKSTITSVGGRAMPVRKKPKPCARSRWYAEAPDFRAQVLGPVDAPFQSWPSCGRRLGPPKSAIFEGFRACSQTSKRRNKSLPNAIMVRFSLLDEPNRSLSDLR